MYGSVPFRFQWFRASQRTNHQTGKVILFFFAMFPALPSVGQAGFVIFVMVACVMVSASLDRDAHQSRYRHRVHSRLPIDEQD